MLASNYMFFHMINFLDLSLILFLLNYYMDDLIFWNLFNQCSVQFVFFAITYKLIFSALNLTL